MHILEISMKNIRSLESHRWSFPPTKCAGWHVVLGDNGSGKSSFLGAIALGLVGAKRAGWLRQAGNRWLTEGKPEGMIRLKITRNGTNEDTEPSDEPFETGIRFIRQPEDAVELVPLSEETDSERTVPHAISRLGWKDSEEWFSISFGPSRRFTKRTIDLPSLPLLVRRHLAIFDDSVSFSKCLDWMQHLKFHALEKDQSDHELLERLIRFMNETGFLPYGVKIDDVTSSDVICRDANGTSVPISNLSDGYRSVLSMTIEIIRQMSSTFDPDEIFDPNDATRIVPDGVVIVDEIDAHLHPKWQSSIGYWFCSHFPNIQFIVSTHSPLVCQAAENGSVYVLPQPGSQEHGGKLKRDTLLRLVYGTVLDAYGTDAFGSEASSTRSSRSQELHQRLAVLNNRELLKGLSSAEERERERLLRKLPVTAAQLR